MTRILLTLLLFTPLSILAQLTITGSVKDTTAAIPFANVIITNQKNEMITGAITNENGKFEVVVTKGDYIVTVSFLGYKNQVQKISVDKSITIGTITLIKDNNELDEVTITAKRPTIKRKVDRLVFYIENSIVASGGDALDVLQKTPGVRVNNDHIGLIGKSTIKVLVNGRISPLSGADLSNYLRSLSAEDISSIEVITNPPAKYEAAGNSGLINIVLKNVKRDYFGGSIRTRYRQTTYPTGYLGGAVTYQKNKLSLFANADSRKGSVLVDENNSIFYPAQQWDTDTQIRYFAAAVSGRAGIDYELSDHTSIGMQYLGATNKPDNKEKTITSIINTSSVVLDSLLTTYGDANKKTYYHSLNGHFKTNLDTIGTSLTIDADYFIYDNALDRENTTESTIREIPLIFKNTSSQNIETITSAIDLELPTTFVDINLGGKISFIKNKSDVKAFDFKEGEFVNLLEQSNVFTYNENTQAAYASGSKSMGKWEVKAGLRIESTQTKGNSFTLNQTNKNKYIKLFPTGYLTYTPTDSHAVSLSYGKRISRPGYSSLNPFRWFSNPYSYTEGNPFLQPSFRDNFELSHVYRDNLSTALYVSIREDGSDQITLTDTSTNIQATVRQNFLDEYTAGFSQSYSLSAGSWLESYVEYDISYLKITSSIPSTIKEQEGFSFYCSIDNSFNFNAKKTVMGEFNFWYSSPSVSGVDKITESYAADVGLKWLLYQKQIQLAFVASDIFRTNKSTIRSVVNGMRQEYRNYYDNQRLRLSATYRFGNKKLRSKKKRFSNEAERRRTD